MCISMTITLMPSKLWRMFCYSSDIPETGNLAYDDDIYEEIEFTAGRKSSQISTTSSPQPLSLPPPTTDFYEEIGSAGGLLSAQSSATPSPGPPFAPLPTAIGAASLDRNPSPLSHFRPPLPVPTSHPSHEGKRVGSGHCGRYVLAKRGVFML